MTMAAAAAALAVVLQKEATRQELSWTMIYKYE
jgi:hypothetical protein